MAIKFIKERSFWWSVVVDVPGDDDKKQKHEFTVYIKDHSTSQYLKALKGGGDSLIEYVVSLVTDWKGVQDENGKEMVCTEDNKRFVFDVHYMFAGLLESLGKIHKGGADEKN